MLASSLQDIDGLGLVISQNLYWDYHHVLGHNLFFGLLLCGMLTVFAQHRLKAFSWCFALFHLHLILDYYGSGPGWGIVYLWPLSDWSIGNPDAWPFYAWQNVVTGYFFVGWTVWIVVVQKRTPLEWPMPSLDQQLVALAQKWRKKP